MKINKFKKNKTFKFRNTKLYKGLVVGTCALTLAATLAGCGQGPVLKDSILDSAVVATVDGDKEILCKKHLYNHIIYDESIENNVYVNHEHYVNVISGEWLADSEGNCVSGELSSGTTVYPRNVEITDIESITNYLTEEEYEKAMEGKFTKDDVIKVLIRIKNLPVEIEEAETQKSR